MQQGAATAFGYHYFGSVRIGRVALYKAIDAVVGITIVVKVIAR
jgi:hypothetical protein